MSIEVMRADACGERKVAPHNMCSSHRSDEKANLPRTLGTPSGRGADVPMRGAVPLETRVEVSVAIGDPIASGGGEAHRFDDASVAGAATQVAGQLFADLDLDGISISIE